MRAREPGMAVPETVSIPELAAAPAHLEASKPRYRKVRSHARGGLGEVFIADDEELKRAIALKEILPWHADNAVHRQRFVQEALVTGHLEHPGIVPIYGLGAGADGRPFYAMRFIRGEGFDFAIDRFHSADFTPRDPSERTLSLRDLLRRFVDVCNAIAFAHSKGVLHRDIKPANIMLGPFGETLVVDWGLAKIIGVAESAGTAFAIPELPGRNPTGDGAIVGTPAYMSPEQAQGSKSLGVASDVYALGAVLYNLLTGRPPADGPLMQVLGVVQTGMVPPVRRIKPTTPPALAAVCHKAMALQPSERYASAKDLAADVEHWLADEPVTAYREPLAARLRRWSRRHRGLVAAGVALVLTATAALAVGLVVVNAARDEEHRAKVAEQKANEALTASRDAERRANVDLKAALERETNALARSRAAENSAAEQRRLALATIRDMLATTREAPNLLTLRKKLYARGLESLKAVARAADTAQQADHETIWAHFDLGHLFLQLEREGAAEAAKQFELAHDLAKKRVEADPGNAEARRDLAVAQKNLGDVQMRLGKPRAALKAYSEAVAMSQKLVADDPRYTEAEHDLSIAHDKVGDAHLQLEEPRKALDAFRAGLTISQKRADLAPDNAELRRDLAVSYLKLGDAQEMLDEIQDALASYRRSNEINQKRVDTDPDNGEALRDLSVALERLGNAQMKLGNHQAALSTYKDSLAISQRLADADPINAEAQRDLAVAHNTLGDAQVKSKDLQAGLTSYRTSFGISQKLAENAPRDALLQRDLVVNCFKLGAVAENARDYREAIAWYEKGLAVTQRFHQPEYFHKETAIFKERLMECRKQLR
jgi:serine/threonine-protein kinase